MEDIIACCGGLCNKCEIYIETLKGNAEKFNELAKKFSTKDYVIKPEEIPCDGCMAGKRIYKFCGECSIRLCAIKKGIENCGLCSEYPCSKLNKVFETSKKSKERLEEINRAK